MRLSIVIPAYNCAETIGAQLQAIADQEWSGDYEIVVADNGSTDSTTTVVDDYRLVDPRVRVVDASGHPGASYARNVGAHEATGECVLFCDSDDVVGSGWLVAMATALETAQLVAARLEHRRLNPEWSVRERGEPQTDGLVDTDPPFLPFAYAPSLGIRRELHDRIGGFDTTFREGGEDNDYCYRAQIAGVPITFVPAAVVHYRHRTEMGAVFRQTRGYGRESVKLLAEYSPYGMQRPSQVHAIVSWLLIVPRMVLELPTKRGRARWIIRLGWRIGRLDASLRTQTLGL